jgi:hypothetical protein
MVVPWYLRAQVEQAVESSFRPGPPRRTSTRRSSCLFGFRNKFVSFVETERGLR